MPSRNLTHRVSKNIEREVIESSYIVPSDSAKSYFTVTKAKGIKGKEPKGYEWRYINHPDSRKVRTLFPESLTYNLFSGLSLTSVLGEVLEPYSIDEILQKWLPRINPELREKLIYGKRYITKRHIIYDVNKDAVKEFFNDMLSKIDYQLGMNDDDNSKSNSIACKWIHFVDVEAEGSNAARRDKGSNISGSL